MNAYEQTVRGEAIRLAKDSGFSAGALEVAEMDYSSIRRGEGGGPALFVVGCELGCPISLDLCPSPTLETTEEDWA